MVRIFDIKPSNLFWLDKKITKTEEPIQVSVCDISLRSGIIIVQNITTTEVYEVRDKDLDYIMITDSFLLNIGFENRRLISSGSNKSNEFIKYYTRTIASEDFIKVTLEFNLENRNWKLSIEDNQYSKIGESNSVYSWNEVQNFVYLFTKGLSIIK